MKTKRTSKSAWLKARNVTRMLRKAAERKLKLVQ